MPAEVITVRRVYLKPRILWKSAHHTAYTAPGQNPNDPSNHHEVFTLTFEFGVARNIPMNVYKAFEAAGIATTERPKLDTDDDDDD